MINVGVSEFWLAFRRLLARKKGQTVSLRSSSPKQGGILKMNYPRRLAKDFLASSALNPRM